MKSAPSEPHRRRTIRLRDYDYTQPGGYFVTVCTHRKLFLFGEIIAGEMRLNPWGRIVQEEWLRSALLRFNVLLDGFIIMPNHLHAIIFLSSAGYPFPVGATRRVAPTPDARPHGPKSGSIGAIIAQFKSNSTKKIMREKQGDKSGQRIEGDPSGQSAEGDPSGRPYRVTTRWQRNYYEHIIRHEEDLHSIRQYIQENPSPLGG